MFPPGSPSSIPVKGTFLAPDDTDRSLLQDFERGGIHLNDPSAGLDYQDWKMWFDADNNAVKLSTVANTDLATVFAASQITELSFTFDQNMRVAIAYVENTIAKLRWYDPITHTTVTDVLQGARSPLIGLDDKRLRSLQTSDVIVCYIKENAVYYRLQRERYIDEHHLQDLPPGRHQLLNVGMTSQNRFEVLARTDG